MRLEDRIAQSPTPGANFFREGDAGGVSAALAAHPGLDVAHQSLGRLGAKRDGEAGAQDGPDEEIQVHENTLRKSASP
jgi:hypothetical protein